MLQNLRKRFLAVVLLGIALAPPALATFPLRLDADAIQILISRRFPDGTLAVLARWGGQAGYPVPGQDANPGVTSHVIALYNASGDLLGTPSIVRPGLGSTAIVNALEIETDGINKYVYVGGEYRGSVTVGTRVLASTPTYNCPSSYRADKEVFVAKFEVGSGSWAWARRFGSFTAHSCPPYGGNPDNNPNGTWIDPAVPQGGMDTKFVPVLPAGADDRLGGLAIGDGGDDFVYLVVASKGVYNRQAMVDYGQPGFDGNSYPSFTSQGSGLVVARTPKARETDLSYPDQYKAGTSEPADALGAVWTVRAIWSIDALYGDTSGQHEVGNWAWEASDLAFDSGYLWVLGSFRHLASGGHGHSSLAGDVRLNQELDLIRIQVPATPDSVGRTRAALHHNYRGLPAPAENFGGNFPSWIQRFPALAYGLEFEQRAGKIVFSALTACSAGTINVNAPYSPTVSVEGSICPDTVDRSIHRHTYGHQWLPGRNPTDIESRPKSYVFVAEATGNLTNWDTQQITVERAYKTSDNWWNDRLTAIEVDVNGSVYVSEVNCVSTPNYPCTSPLTARITRLGPTLAEQWTTPTLVAPTTGGVRLLDPGIDYRESPLSLDLAGPTGSTQVFYGFTLLANSSVTLDSATTIQTGADQAGFLGILDASGNWQRRYAVPLGTMVPRPGGVASVQASAPAISVAGLVQSEANAFFYWDDLNDQLWAVKPGAAMLSWQPAIAGDPQIVQAVDITLPTTPQVHAAGAPTFLDSSITGSVYQQMHYNEGGLSAITTAVFNRSEPGWSVLRYSSPDGPRFDAVRTVMPLDSVLAGVACTVGVPLLDLVHTEAGRTGHVVQLVGNYDPAAPYNRASRTGQIVAPNQGMIDVVWSTASATSGVYWPDSTRSHTCAWPAAPYSTIQVHSGSGGSLTGASNAEIYVQNNAALAGFNPNNEHAFLAPSAAGSPTNAVFAMRFEAPDSTGPEDKLRPYVVVKHRANVILPWSYRVYAVADGAAGSSHSNVTVGAHLAPPYPAPVLGDCPGTHGEEDAGGNPTQTGYWEDVRGKVFARSDGSINVYFKYPLRADFFWDPANTGSNSGTAGTCVALRRDPTGGSEVAYPFSATWGTLPVLRVGDRLFDAKDGLPDLRHQAAVEVIFEGDLAAPSTALASTSLVRLTDPLTTRWVPVPAGFSLSAFALVPYEIRVRLEYDAVGNRLGFNGYEDDSLLGEPLLLPNVMLEWEREALKGASGCTGTCDSAVDALFALTNNPNGVTAAHPFLLPPSALFVGLERNGANGTTGSGLRTERLSGSAAMLTAGAARQTGRVTLVLNNDASLDPQALPTTVVPISIGCTNAGGQHYLGSLQQMPTDNVFEQRLVLRHSSDHGFEPKNHNFGWYWAPSVPPPATPTHNDFSLPAGWAPAPTSPGQDAVVGRTRFTIEGANFETIIDNEVVMEWVSLACGRVHNWVGDPSSTTAATRTRLAEGWVKRVVRNLNPFRARVTDFRGAETATYASAIRQAGEPYAGPITFNGDPANINSLGLIEAYETVLRSALELTVDSSNAAAQASPAGHEALLLISTRIAELYTLLGNEAIADASDPTIAFSSQSGEYGTLAPAIFAFQNQVPSLLEEELGLLRGRDDSGAATNLFPVYNRFIWNFTSGEGEVAYSQVYNLDDENNDAFLNEADARIMFPQGHGDAWGHLLTAEKRWYNLLRHGNFEWKPRAEKVNVAGTAVTVDYRDERKFAQVAAIKAKVGAEVVNMTYRKEYVEEPAGQFQGYEDPDADRAWGVDDWARRAAQSAYFDWAVANAILPAEWQPEARTCTLYGPVASGGLGPDDEECPTAAVVNELGQIDRTKVPELAEITEQYQDVQRRLDEADLGLNPLGLAKGVVPFDIDPSLVDPPVGPGKTHFEQVYDRAIQALSSAVSVFDHAASLTQNLRRNQDSLSDFQDNTEDQERDYRNRLIEIFGYPYEDDIGAPPRSYPAGYEGPDLFHYMYVDEKEIAGLTPEPRQQITAYFKPLAGVGEFFPGSDGPEPPGATVLEVLYEYEPGGPGLTKPSTWTGGRRAPGKLQEALSNIRQAEFDRLAALQAYDELIYDIEEGRGDLEQHRDFGAAVLNVIDDNITTQATLGSFIVALNTTSAIMENQADAVEEVAEAGAEALPKSAGLATDVTAPLRGALKTAGAISSTVLEIGAQVADTAANTMELGAAMADLAASRRLEALGLANDLEDERGDVEALLRQEPAARLAVMHETEMVAQMHGRYAAILSEGLRLLDERTTFRMRTAGDVQQYRYEDMTFRIMRNDAIQKYRAQFDLAARYAYLAAATYDYETNLLGSNAGSGEAFLTDIVRHRTLGQINDGVPQAGSRGLADPLARMKLNFDVLKGQMGFNNPQTETNRFSLRSEMMRLRDESDEAWEAELRKYLVDNLWDLPEFRRLARPFAPEESGRQPALVIGLTDKGGQALATTVTSGLNFFGRELGGGDSTYDPTNFVTKIRSVGVWFNNYDASGLSNTPRVYLLPVGADVLRAAGATDFGTRQWQVVDQALPVPFPIGPTSLSDPEYIPANALSDSFVSVRRFSRFRAYHDSGGFNPAETTTDSRLIGRSVWNTRWLLIIPGETLLADPDQGLETFIQDVDDIQMFFQTYAFSGN